MNSEKSTFYIANPDYGDLLCFGEIEVLEQHHPIDWGKVDVFTQKYKNHFIATILSYDLKNSIERLASNNADFFRALDLVLLVPESVYQVRGTSYELLFGAEQDSLARNFLDEPNSTEKFTLKPALTKENYIEKVGLIKNEIQLGNCYELNFCQNFETVLDTELDTVAVFKELYEHSKAPFSTYIKYKNWHMMGASPERFIKKAGSRLISQPIKGTRPRGLSLQEDERLRSELQNDTKERAENIMIVDLVRNDLTRVAVPQTIHVDELCGIYTFHAVHQMISTVSCLLRPDASFSNILNALFPMGSMTGAPKISAMQLIDQFEQFKRGWYSGSVGVIYPNGDFDLNVVIRSLLFNESNNYLCCPVGSAITILSEAEKEYEECLYKIGKILALFS